MRDKKLEELAGSDEELLNYCKGDKQAKNWYIVNIYGHGWAAGEW
jgi:hypothetical protein